MIRGIQLTLMAGPGVVVPVPRDVLDALQSVKVTVAAGETASGFELTFSIDKRSALNTIFLLSAGASPPIMRVLLIVTINGQPATLIDGVMTHHQLAPGSAREGSTLTVQGKDLTAVMDLIDFTGIPYPALPHIARVAIVLAKYAWLGIVPKVVPSLVDEVPLPIERIPIHWGSDLYYLQTLARQVGYAFYLEPGPAPGTSFAYWGPELRVGRPQPALNLDMDVHTNVESMSFSYDKEAKELPIVRIQEENTKAPLMIPIPDITPLNPPLGLIGPIPPKIKALDDTAHLKPGQALMRGIAYAAQHSDTVTATGSLDVLRYGRVLSARKLVGLRGAGVAFDGLYYVSQVSHEIKRGSYKQSFTLKRNGLMSTVPAVSL